MGHIRRYLIAGLLVWVPVGFTVLVIKFLVDLMDRTLLLLPPGLRPENLLGFRIPGLSVLLTVVVVLVTGVIAATGAWRGPDRFRGEARLETWFYRILVRQAANHRRWRAVRDRWNGLFPEDAPDPSPRARGLANSR